VDRARGIGGRASKVRWAPGGGGEPRVDRPRVRPRGPSTSARPPADEQDRADESARPGMRGAAAVLVGLGFGLSKRGYVVGKRSAGQGPGRARAGRIGAPVAPRRGDEQPETPATEVGAGGASSERGLAERERSTRNTRPRVFSTPGWPRSQVSAPMKYSTARSRDRRGRPGDTEVADGERRMQW